MFIIIKLKFFKHRTLSSGVDWPLKWLKFFSQFFSRLWHRFFSARGKSLIRNLWKSLWKSPPMPQADTILKNEKSPTPNFEVIYPSFLSSFAKYLSKSTEKRTKFTRKSQNQVKTSFSRENFTEKFKWMKNSQKFPFVVYPLKVFVKNYRYNIICFRAF